MPESRSTGRALRAWTIFALAATLVAAAPLPIAAQQRPRPFPVPGERAQGEPPEEQPKIAIFPLSVLWTVKLAGPPAIEPAFDGDRIFVAMKPIVEEGVQTQAPMLAAYSIATGASLWQHEMRDAAAVTAGGNAVYACSGSLLQAFNQSDGAARWEALLDAPPAAPLHYASGWLVAATQGSRAFGLSARDGRKVWQAQLPSPATGEPEGAGDRVYLPLTDNRVVSLDLEKGAVAWDRRILSKPTAILALDDRIYVGTAEHWFYALDPRDGRVLWRTRVGSATVGRPTADRDTVFFLALDNLLRAIDRSGGALRWRQVLLRRARFGPFMAGNLLFVSGLSTSIQAYGAGHGDPAGTFDAPKDLFAPVHLVPGLVDFDFLLIALTGEGDLVAIRPKSIEPEPFALSPMVALMAGFPVWVY